MPENRWLQKIAESPGHSQWYIERFRQMVAEGADLDGEERRSAARAPERPGADESQRHGGRQRQRRARAGE